MSSEIYCVTIAQPLEKVWATVLEPGSWLPSIPGYQSHTNLKNNCYQVLVHIDIGPVTKQTVLTFQFCPSKKENTLFFSFRSTNGKVQGEGKIQAIETSMLTTDMVVQVDLTVKSKSSRLVKPFLPSIKQSWAKEITHNFVTLLHE